MQGKREGGCHFHDRYINLSLTLSYKIALPVNVIYAADWDTYPIISLILLR
jgi:hypothetical protein